MSCHCNITAILEYDKNTGKPLVWCDYCLAPIIKALNEIGLKTIASCCGHLVRPASIILEDNREILIMPYDIARKIDKLWPPINRKEK